MCAIITEGPASVVSDCEAGSGKLIQRCKPSLGTGGAASLHPWSLGESLPVPHSPTMPDGGVDRSR